MVLRQRSNLNIHLIRSDEKGQAVTEYLILVSVIILLILSVEQWISKTGLALKLQQTLTGPFASAYRYGNVHAKGFDDGGPDNHPRVVGGNNFRIFTLQN